MLGGLICLLALTLLNAWLLHNARTFVSAHDFAPFQVTAHNAAHYEWDIFIARELAALILTILLFGGIAGLRVRKRRRTPAHQPFADAISNRRR